jgi:hypothetical protein
MDDAPRDLLTLTLDFATIEPSRELRLLGVTYFGALCWSSQ